MSPPHTPVDDAPIAGEPAHDQNSKMVPPVTTGNQNPASQSQERFGGMRNGRYEGVAARNRRESRNKVFAVVQIIAVITALCISAYALVVLNALDVQPGSAGQDASETLVKTEGRAADEVCTEGGADIFIGTDYNANGVLDDVEITSTTKVCHGKEGLSGPQGAPGEVGSNGTASLIRTTELSIGDENCTEGGLMIDSGIDIDGDGNLSDEEVSTTNFVCDGKIGSDGTSGTEGSEGAPALIDRVSPDPSICPDGFIIRFGIDNGVGEGTEFDGILDNDEVAEELKVCSTPLESGRISDIVPGVTDSFSIGCSESFEFSSKNIMLFTAVSISDGCELFVSDGTAQGTQLLMDINTVGDSIPGQLLGFTPTTDGSKVIFDANNGINGRELWISDGTEIGTMLLQDFKAGDTINGVSKIAPLGDGAVVITSDQVLNFVNESGYVSLATMTGSSTLATEIATLASIGTEFLATDASGIWFSAKDENGFLEPYHISMQGDLTHYDLNEQGSATSGAYTLVTGGLVVESTNGVNGRQLAMLYPDGSHAWLTSLVMSGSGTPTQEVGQTFGIVALGETLVFDANTSGNGATLWSYDMKTDQTRLLSSSLENAGLFVEPVVKEGKVWFDCSTPSTGSELCVSDGTVSGTKMVADVYSGTTSSEIKAISSVSNKIVFLGRGDDSSGVHGHSLWSYDPVTEEYEMVYNAWQGAGNDSGAGTYGGLSITNGRVIFVSSDDSTGHELHAWNHLVLDDEWLVLA